MKHKDLIEVRRDYRPVFTLGQEESELTWKSFIPHANFLELLQKAINIVDGKDKRTALWLQGSYGVGKSHACSVIAHLLSDSLEEIKDYIEKDIQNPQIAGLIKSLRERKRFIPVYMIGTGDVPALEYMSFYIKSYIKKKLVELGFDIPIPQTEVELLIEQVNKEDENQILRKFPEYSSKSALQEDLKKNPPDDLALRKTYDYFAKKGIHISKDLKGWLQEVNSIIQENGYDGILLIWDEFTQVLDTGLSYLEKLQNLLAENPNLYLIVVSHRMADFYKEQFGETYRKVADRFVHHKLELAETTVFHILKRAINRKDGWEEIRNAKFANLSHLIDHITKLFETQKPRAEDIRDLYPLHPYTILLATHVAEKFFSSGRSIFGYLFEENGALKKLMEKDVEEEPFLTVDTLWDYFSNQIRERDYGDFARDVVNHYTNQKSKIRELGEDYIKVFKALMILNLLYKFTDYPQSYLHPTEENVKIAYTGTTLENKVDSFLEKIHEEGILQKSPDGKYLVLSSSLPEEELKGEEIRLKQEFKEVYKVIGAYAKEKVKEILLKDFYREADILILGSDESYRYKVKPSHRIQVVIGFPKTPAEKEEYQEKFKKASEECRHAVFIVWGDELREDKLLEWIKWKTREKVANSHRLIEEKNYAEGMANKILEDFLNRDVHLYLFFRNNEESISKRSIPYYLKKYSKDIFSKGPDALDIENKNLWNKAGKTLLSRLVASQRSDELREHISRGPEKDLQQALYDVDRKEIFLEDLSLNPKADPSHPIVNLSRELEDKFKKKQRLRVEDLKFLREPPYGLYNNKISVFMLAAAFKPFQNKLHRVGVGRASIKNLEDFARAILEEKRSDIELRYGSEIEDKLADFLKDIFSNLVNFKEEDKDLIRVRNTIRDKIQDIGIPMWSLAHLEDEVLGDFCSDTEFLKEVIREISKFIASSDTEFKDDHILTLSDNINKLKNSLKHLFSEENLIKGRRLFIERKIGQRKISKEELGKKLKERLPQNAIFCDESQVSSIVDRLIEELERKIQEKLIEEPYGKSEADGVEHAGTSTDTTLTGEPDLGYILQKLGHSELVNLIIDITKEYQEIESFILSWLKNRDYV